MKYIAKNIAHYWKMVCIIILLLIVQAYGDLALPQYTSDIIDTGIQGQGMTSVLPEKITNKDYEMLAAVMTEEEKNLWAEYYQQENEGFTRIRQADDAAEEQFLVPILMVYYMSAAKEQMTGEAAMTEDVSLPSDVSMMTGEFSSQQMRKAAEEKLDSMRETMGDATLVSMGYAWAAGCETNAGIDMKQKQVSYLWVSGAKMLGFALLMALVSIVVSFLAAKVGANIGKNLRHEVFHKVVGFSGAEMDQFSTASLITRCTNDVQQIQMVTIMLLRMVLYAPILGIGGIMKVAQSNAGMGWIVFLAVFLILAFVLTLMSVTMPKFKMMQVLVDRINLVAREILTGLNVIRAFGREQKEEERFDIANKELTRTQLFTNRVMTFMMPGMMTIMYAIDILIVWVAAARIDSGLMQVGTMTAFITYAMQIVISFLMLTMMSIMLPRAGVAAERIQKVLDTEESITEAAHKTTLEDPKGLVEFKQVDFRYPNAKEDVLSEISFTARPGETTAIIGSTGCGKSTLVHLLPRLYDVTQGEITIDGHNIKELSLEQLRDMIGFVPQKATLFSGTIESNIRFGNQTASDEVVEEAASIAQAMEFISEKKEGFLSTIAQGGSNVSGGQKQRLSIARAIAKKPKIFVFDDSFSALDMKTDGILRRALAKQVKDSTVIIVAQRISTILHADQILVLDDGKIVGKGRHEELLKTCDTYLQIATSQLSEKELGIASEGRQEVLV